MFDCKTYHVLKTKVRPCRLYVKSLITAVLVKYLHALLWSFAVGRGRRCDLISRYYTCCSGTCGGHLILAAGRSDGRHLSMRTQLLRAIFWLDSRRLHLILLLRLLLFLSFWCFRRLLAAVVVRECLLTHWSNFYVPLTKSLFSYLHLYSKLICFMWLIFDNFWINCNISFYCLNYWSISITLLKHFYWLQ